MITPIISRYTADSVPESFFSARRLDDALDVAAQILAAVRKGGDTAVRQYAAQFDRANPTRLEVSSDDVHAAEEVLKKENPELYTALCHSRDLAMQFALRQKESFDTFETELLPGLITGQKTIPVERAGVYVPGGRFPLFSSVIMGVTPAKAAGCDSVIFCSPPVPHPSGDPEAPYCDARILAVASLCGVDRVFSAGGAQAIAAMAYGTESIPSVNVVVGPGNKFVTAAKRLVFGEVGIDIPAGPSEVMILADDSANPVWVAADMIAQAEHDVDAQAVLLTPSAALADAVVSELMHQLDTLPNDAPARKSLGGNSAVITIESWEQAIILANRKAPEHLELALEAGRERDHLVQELKNYGSLFIGHGSAEILGDYAAGLNHTLPTSGAAHFTGGLSVRHFLKTVTTLRTGEAGSDRSGWHASLVAAEQLALAEGLTFHAQAARCRMETSIEKD